MKKKLLSLLLLLTMLTGIVAFALPASASADGNTKIERSDIPLRLWYDTEAIKSGENSPTVSTSNGAGADVGWERWSLPIGNGYFGANVFGRTETERIQISDKTLQDRPLTENGKSIGGLNSFSETYIDFGHTNSEVTDYIRYLDVNTAISGVEYTYGGVTYTREYFTSYPDNALVIRLDANTDGALSFTLRPTVPYKKSYGIKPNDGFGKTGTVTSIVNNGVGEIELSGKMKWFDIDFLGMYRVYTNGGTVTASTAKNTYTDSDGTQITDTNGTIVVNGATSAYIVVTLGSDYELEEKIFSAGDHINQRFEKPTYKRDLTYVRNKVQGYMNAVLSKISGESFENSYKILKDTHVDDYKSLFDRVTLNLGCKEADYALTTDVLLKNYQDGSKSAYLETLMFQYGRYLLIASSRPGTMPAHLQGAWNTYDVPPWACGYWHNINVQMNYWPAFSTNIAETFEAYVDYNKAYMAQAEKYADELIQQYNPDVYDKDGGNGWVIGYDGYQFRITSDRSPGNLGLTTQLFWEYYAYTQDPAVLNYVYDTLTNAAKYITKSVKLDENKNYVVEYCDSPEMFVNGEWYYTEGTTYAQTFAYVNNYNALEAAKALGIDLNNKELLTTEEYSILNTIMEQLNKYNPIKVGLSGQIKEFAEEDYYGSIGDEYQHRHTSQLVGLYPGNLINGTTPAWLDAAKVTLNERGDHGTGWGIAMKLNMWARIGDADRAYALLSNIIKEETAANLWTLHPPFQIDANFGTTAGISEMLLQSHEGYISPLAVLPSNWQTGSYTGLVARGNFEVSAAWENGLAKTFNITSKSGGTASVYYPSITNASVVDSDGNKVNYTVEGTNLISFETKVGETYIIYGFKSVSKPSAPKNLDYVINSDGNYELTWSSSSGATSYNVYVAIESASTYTRIGTTNSTSFTYVPKAENKTARTTFAVTAVSEGESARALAYTSEAFKTEYGFIPKEHVGYPYSVFVKGPNDSEYVFVDSCISYIDAANKASDLIKVGSGAYKGGTAVIYVMRDSKASGSAFNNASNIDGTLIIDLGGNQLTVGIPRLIGFEAKKVNNTVSNVSKVIVKNGTVITNGTPVAEVYCGGTTGSFNYTGTKKFELLFDSVSFAKGLLKKDNWSAAVSILKSRGTFTSSKQAELKAEFKNCTFDYADETNTFTLIDLSAGGEYAKCNITVTGGKILAPNESRVQLYKGSVNDTITYQKDSNGNMLEYELGSGTPPLVTLYGNIPTADMTSDKHFAVFAKKANDSSYTYMGTFGSLLKGALNNSRDMVKRGSGAYAGGTVVIYMFKDYTYQADGSDNGSFNRAFMIDGTMVIDLGGNTITGKRSRLIGFETGSDDIIGAPEEYNSIVKFKNGTILTSNPVAEIFKGSSAFTGTKKCEIAFDGVTFTSTAGEVSILKTRGDFGSAQNVECKISFTDCVFDYPSQTSVMLFEDSSPIGRADCDVTVSGGKFITNSFDALSLINTSDSLDTLLFVKKDGGYYTTLLLPLNADTPDATFNGGTLGFIKLSENNDNSTFILGPTTLNSYAPKMSITLDSSLVINVYVPVELTKEFTFDNKRYSNLGEIENKIVTLADGKLYYLMSTELSSSEAARELVLSVKVSCDGISINGNFTFSIPKYGKQLLDDGSNIEKSIVKDVLSYIRSAYIYFGINDEDAIESIGALLGESYDGSHTHSAQGSDVPPSQGLSAVTFALNSTPAIKFYITDGADASDYAFYINGRKLTVKNGTDANGTYIEMDVYAYEMCETVTYTIDGIEAGSYHINSYYKWSKTQNDAKLVTLVERFWRYCQSARDYKNSVSIQINYVDENGNEVAKTYSSRFERGSEFSILSPTVPGYYTRDIYLISSATEDKVFNVTYKQIPADTNAQTLKEKLPDIVAWGDSITAGTGQENIDAANEHRINLSALGSSAGGANYPTVLKNLIMSKIYGGIDIANCGVGGEITASIAARADTETYYLYLDDAVTIAPGASVVIPLTHYAAATIERAGILRQGGAPTVNSVTIVGKDANGNDVSVTGNIAKATLTDDAPSGSSTHTCDVKYLKYTFTRTDAGTETVSFVPGARVIAKSSYLYDGRTCIIFMGENGGYSDMAELIKQQEEILEACKNPEYYLIISTTSGSTESRKELNDALTERWGDRYINMGNELNSSTKAYELAGYSDDAIESIRENIKNGTVSELLIKDNCHPNAVGYAVIGNIIFERMFRIGAFNAIFDYYDSFQ